MKKKMNTTYMVELAVLIAIILIMAFTPIGYIRTLGLEITLIVVPVAVGAVTLGPMAGLILGTIFGITSFIQCFGMSAFGVMLLSINPVFTTIVGLCVANAFTALSGCLLAQSQRSADVNIGTGMVTIALASLLIGGTVMGKGGILTRAVGVVLGSFIFRLVYTIALRFDMPAFMLKLVSSVIVVLAISAPYLKSRWPMIRRRMTHSSSVSKGGEGKC